MNPDIAAHSTASFCDESSPKELLRISAELFTIPVGEAYLIYAPLRQAAFLSNAAGVNFLADLQHGRVDTTAPNYKDTVAFLRELQMIDAGEEKKPITTFAGEPKPTALTLFLTTACNLRCSYCYASAGETPVRVMPMEVAKRGIDFVIANALELGRDHIEIAYHGGGEPSINWATLTGSYEYAREQTSRHKLVVAADLTTNGVMTDHKIDWIIRHLDCVSISFDGLPDVHDAHRVDVHGAGTAAKVIRSIRRFDVERFRYGLRLTVTREHIARMAESVRYICENFHPERIGMEPAFQMGRWRQAPSVEAAEFIAAFRDAQAVARSYGREIVFSGARLDILSNHFCGATRDNFCLTADGHVSACFEAFMPEAEWSNVFLYGKYDPEKKTYNFNPSALEHLRHQSVDHREFCQGCFAKWSCSGHCYHHALSVSGVDDFQGTDRCHIIRELTKDQILERIGKNGGVAWHEPR